MLGKGIDRVRLIARDNLEGILISIIAKKIFEDRTELELVNNFNKIKEENLTEESLEPVKSLLIVGNGLKSDSKEEIEKKCKKKNIKFKYFINEYKKNSRYLRTESLEDFLKSFEKYPKIMKKIDNFNSLIDTLLLNEDFDKKFELMKLMNVLGKKRFIERFTEDSSIELSQDEKSLIILESERIERELYRLINSVIAVDLIKGSKQAVKAKIGFSSPINPIYSDYYLSEILKKDGSIDLAVLMELPESITFKFKEGRESEEIIKKLRGVEIGNKLFRSEFKSFGVKKNIFELLRFYGIEMKF
jgi:hypothetical protein